MMFGAWGNPDHDESIRIIHAALDAGINFIDTADVYSGGESEEIVGKALAGGRRDDVVLATKVNFPMGEDPNRRGNSRRWIVREVEDSLRRLDTDWIDLYQIHRPDPHTDIEETLGALTDLVQQGKIRYIGSSTFPASQIVEAQWAARDRRLQRFVSEQPPYSILVRGIEADVLPTCARHGMARHPVGAARQRLAVGPLPQGLRPARLDPLGPASRALRPVGPGEPAQARRRRRARHDSPTRRGSRSSSSRSPSSSTTPRSPRRSSARARWSTSRASSRPRTSCSTQALLDRIDEIVPPGTTINPAADSGLANPDLEPAARRRTLA